MKTAKSFQSNSSLAATLTLSLFTLTANSASAVSQKFTTTGTFTPPAGITSITVECWGGGGAGGSANKGASPAGNAGGGGGGGGAYAKKLDIPVTPGTPYTVTIPAIAPGLTTFTNGQTSDGASVTFTGDTGVSVTANGGQGGACVVTTASAVSGVGGAGGAVSGLYDVEWSGGGGWRNTSVGNAGAGGSAASDTKNGVTATTQSTGTNLSVTAGSDADHNGGRGDTGKSASGAGNSLNTAPGGGGGGGRAGTASTTLVGASGKAGQIIITYSGATASKANNADDLNLGSSWAGGSAPDSSGIAKWDATVTSANTTSLGADVAWGSIVIADPAGLVTINSGNTLTNNGGIDMSASTTDFTLNCNYVLGNSAVWNVASGQTLALGGIVSGGSGLNITKQGSGKLILSGANTYSGATAITGGTLQLGASNVIPEGSGKGDISVSGGASLDLNGHSETVNGLNGGSGNFVDNTAASATSTLTVGSNDVTSVFNGIIQNTGTDSTTHLIKTGAGQLTLAGTNTLRGTVTVNGGTLAVQNANPLADISELSIGGATLGFNNNNPTMFAPVTLTGNTTFKVLAAGVLGSLNGAIGGTGDITFATGDNTLAGDNRVLLGAAGNFTGNVMITTSATSILNSLTVQLGAVNTLPVTAVVTLDGRNGNNGAQWCDLDLNGYDQTLAGLTNVTRSSRLQRVYSSAGPATLTINSSTDHSFGGLLGNSSAGGDDFGLTKSGAGTFTLSGTNVYIGDTLVSAGTLLVNGDQSAATGLVTVAANATLGGTGTLGGATTVNGNLAPGSSTVGQLTFGAGGVTLGNLAPGSLKFELGANTTAGTTYDTVVTSALNIGTLDFADFQFTDTGALAAGVYTLIRSEALPTGSIGNASGTIGTFNGSLSISGNDLILTVTASGSPYTTWAAGFPSFTPTTGTLDFENDGIQNLLEFVLGGNPTTHDSPSILPTVSASGSDLVVTFGRTDLSESQSVTVKVQTSPDLATWTDFMTIGAVSGSGYTVAENAANADTIVVTIPKAAATKKFARVTAE
jgi:autotransporter-associated beta strand protein